MPVGEKIEDFVFDVCMAIWFFVCAIVFIGLFWWLVASTAHNTAFNRWESQGDCHDQIDIYDNCDGKVDGY